MHEKLPQPQIMYPSLFPILALSFCKLGWFSKLRVIDWSRQGLRGGVWSRASACNISLFKGPGTDPPRPLPLQTETPIPQNHTGSEIWPMLVAQGQTGWTGHTRAFNQRPNYPSRSWGLMLWWYRGIHFPTGPWEKPIPETHVSHSERQS